MMSYIYYPNRYSTGGCAGQTELGASYKPVVEECAAACDTAQTCVSFEYRKEGPNASGTNCQLSTSCDDYSLTLKNLTDDYMWYEKSNGYTMHEHTVGNSYLWLIN